MRGCHCVHNRGMNHANTSELPLQCSDLIVRTDERFYNWLDTAVMYRLDRDNLFHNSLDMAVRYRSDNGKPSYNSFDMAVVTDDRKRSWGPLPSGCNCSVSLEGHEWRNESHAHTCLNILMARHECRHNDSHAYTEKSLGTFVLSLCLCVRDCHCVYIRV